MNFPAHIRAAIIQRASLALAGFLNPRVGAEFKRLQGEIGKLATDNARLQQEVSALSALRVRGR